MADRPGDDESIVPANLGYYAAGLERDRLFEGPGWWIPQPFTEWWDDETQRERLLAAVRAVEREPTLLGLGPHLMVVARNE